MTPNAAATQSLDPFTRMVQAAIAAGCPRDQVMNFWNAGYIPTPKQWEFHAAARQADIKGLADDIGIGGARGGAKTHGVFAQIALDDCVRVPESKWLYLRKVKKAARESLQDLCRKVLKTTNYRPNWQEGIIRLLDSGSTIIAGHFQNESDIDQYLGQEYDGVVIEEYTQLSDKKIELIHGSVRSSKPHWRPRKYNTTNPGGVGHGDFKKKFVLPYREKRERYTRFIPMSYKDNSFFDEGYIRYLERLTGILGKMWRDGDWDTGAGQFFVHWNYGEHVIPAQRWQYHRLPAHYPLWAGFDYGWSHPTSVHFFTAIGQDIYTIGEHGQSYWLPKQHAAQLGEMVERFGRTLNQVEFYAGHDCFATRHTGRTIADDYAEEGIRMRPAIIDRVQGAAAMLSRLGNAAEGQPATWRILDTCPKLAEVMPGMQTNPAHPQDVLKVDAGEDGEGGDDPYDSARYGLMAAGGMIGVQTVEVNMKAGRKTRRPGARR